MTANLRKHWLQVRASYWFIPTLLTLAAIALAVGTLWVDHNGLVGWLWGTGWLRTTSAEGARGLLSVIASAMISIASTVFAITIAAVVYASGNYGPRLLSNFMNDRGNQVSLGTFIATFVYTLLVLRTVRISDDLTGSAFVPQLSTLVSTVLVFCAVLVLVYFLHHVPASIRINTVLAGIGRKLLDDIAERFPHSQGAETAPELDRFRPVTAVGSGYIEIIDFAALDRLAKEHGAAISLCVRTGDFVHPHISLVELSGTATDEKLESGIRDAFAMGDSRTSEQDIEFLFDELVEIALRALSPGINDPFTAITSLHWMGAALASLADRDLSRGPEQQTFDRARVRPRPDSFEHFIERGLGAVRGSVAANPLATRVCLAAIADVGAGRITEARRADLAAEAERLFRQAMTVLQGPDRDDVSERFQEVRQRLATGG
jgi:uncharacterized membrane protein